MTLDEQARWRRVRDIFAIATDADSSDRIGIVQSLCGGDHELQTKLEDLLALQKAPGLALDHPPAPAHLQPGDCVGGKYRIVRFIAHGGMGEVYEAELQEAEPGAVALKFVSHVREGSGIADARFLREVRAVRKIEHPNVCRMFDLGEHDGRFFCAMELLRGETLAAKLDREGKLAPAVALSIALQLCDGLQAAHCAGVLHRDLKPSNIFLEVGRVVIIDFGLAAEAAAPDVSLTASGAVIGTLAYIAPELLEEGQDGPRADLYSLGVILYEMLTGEKPHRAKSPFRLAAQKARESHLSLGGRAAAAMPALWHEVITRSLKPRAVDRYPDAASLKRALLRGRPSVRYVFARPQIFAPLAALVLGLLAWTSWQWAGQDYQPRAEAARLYSQGYEAMTETSPMRAVTALEQAVALDPRFLNARSLLAVAHSETDQMDKAKDTLLQAIAAKGQRWMPGRGETRALDAASAAVIHDFANAAEQYRQLATLPDNRVFALLSRARMLEEAGQFGKAIETVEGVINAAHGESSISAARVLLARLLLRQGDKTRAITEFGRAETAYQNNSNQEGLCDVWIARASSGSQSPEQNRRDLERVFQVSTTTANRYQYLTAREQLVGVLEAEGNYERAIFLAGETADEAQREGMLTLAAKANADLGYAYMFLRDPPKAVQVLRQSIDLASRAKSYSLLNATRIRFGEALAVAGQGNEAVAVMEPAVQWYRRDGGAGRLAHVLLKFGTALNGHSERFAEAPIAFEEAYRLAVKSGDEVYQAMALQRLAGVACQGDHRKAQQYWERALLHCKNVRLTLFYSKASYAWADLGEVDRARQLIQEGQRQIRENYPEGIDRRVLLNAASDALAHLNMVQGRCAEAVSLWKDIKPVQDDYGFSMRQARACAGTASTASIRKDLAWMEEKLHPASRTLNTRAWISAADVAARLADWQAAKRLALSGMEASRAIRVRGDEMENLMILRAAERKIGSRANADRLSAQILSLAAQIGFENAPDFRGRRDLVYLWKRGNPQAAPNPRLSPAPISIAPQ